MTAMLPEDRRLLQETRDTTVAMHTLLENHLQNHIKQPCESMKNLQRNLFVVGLAAVSALIKVVWDSLTEPH